jgi:hypothetical protein
MDVPILFEAACACSLASFPGSMVELTVDLRSPLRLVDALTQWRKNKVSRFAAKQW